MEGARFCGTCGDPLLDRSADMGHQAAHARRHCSACGAVLAQETGFCTACGQPVSSPAREPQKLAQVAKPKKLVGPAAGLAPSHSVYEAPVKEEPEPKPSGKVKPGKRNRIRTSPERDRGRPPSKARGPSPTLKRLVDSWRVVALVAVGIAVGIWWSYFHVILANPLVTTGTWKAVPGTAEFDLVGVVVQPVPDGLSFQMQGQETTKELVFRSSGRRQYRHESADIVYIAELERFNRLSLERRVLGGGGIQRALLVRGFEP